MQTFQIITDLTADLTADYVKENQIPLVALAFSFDGVSYVTEWQSEQNVTAFYAQMRSGKMPTTQLANPYQMVECYEPYLEKGLDVLHLCFSSGLSGTFNSALLARDELRERFPERRIEVVDTKAAAGGQGLLVHHAIRLQKEGKSFDEVLAWLNGNILKLCHLFFVEDLNHLHRGGRVSKATAIVGSVLGIRPILHVDDEGHLINIAKERGRMKAIDHIVKLYGELTLEKKDQLLYISHGDCLEDALLLKEKISFAYGAEQFVISPLDPVIGAHAGPGTLAFFFLGKHR